MVKLVIFDLDGTLVDSAADIARSVNELLSSMGRHVLPHERIYGYIGDGVQRLLERALGDAAPPDVAKTVALYLAIYRRRLLDHTRPYPGVVPALETLHRDRTLAILTNKPLRESQTILRGLGLDRYFRAVYGGDSFHHKKPDPVGILHLLQEFDTTPEEALFVGDSGVDVETARRASVRSCLVSYGLGGGEALDADIRVDDLRELVPLVHS